MVSIKIISSRTDTFTSLDLIHAYLNNREWKINVCIYCSWYIDFICVNPFHKPSSVYFYPSQNQNTTYYHISEYSCQYIAICLRNNKKFFIWLKVHNSMHWQFFSDFILLFILRFGILTMYITSKIGGIQQTHKMWQAVMRMYLVMKKDGWNISLFPTIVRIFHWYHLGVL